MIPTAPAIEQLQRAIELLQQARPERAAAVLRQVLAYLNPRRLEGDVNRTL